MMKFYANLFALTAESISMKAIRRLRRLTSGSLLYLPMVIYLILNGLPRGYGAIPFIIFFVFCSVLVVTVLLARIVNRVWAPDKYLDEWEKDIKRRSMTNAYMAIIYVVIIMAIVLVGLHYFAAPLADQTVKALPVLFLVIIVAVGFYTQVFTQLSLIQPMEEDELEAPQYVVTSARSILGIIALVAVILVSSAVVSGYYFGHRQHDIEHVAAQEACGDLDVDTHKKAEGVIEVTCKESDDVIRLDPETLKTI